MPPLKLIINHKKISPNLNLIKIPQEKLFDKGVDLKREIVAVNKNNKKVAMCFNVSDNSLNIDASAVALLFYPRPLVKQKEEFFTEREFKL